MDSGSVKLTDSFIHSFVRSFVPSFVRSFLRSFVHSFIYSLIPSANHSSTHPFTASRKHSYRQLIFLIVTPIFGNFRESAPCYIYIKVLIALTAVVATRTIITTLRKRKPIHA